MLEVDKISSLSYLEHIQLRSTLHALSNRKFICSTCQNQHNNRSDAKEMLAKTKKLNGCEKPHQSPVHRVTQGTTRLAYKSCVGNYFSYSAMNWIGFFNSYENGVMPFAGGYMDQPAKFIDVMAIIANHKNDEMLKAAQQQKQSAKRRGARG